MSATLTGVDDDLDDDGETVVVSGTHNGAAFGDRRTVAIEDDDDPEVTVSFAQGGYRAAEGGHVDVAVTLSAVPERQVTIPVEAEGADGADSADFSISPSSLSFGANETDRDSAGERRERQRGGPGRARGAQVRHPVARADLGGRHRGSDGRDPGYGLHLRARLRGRRRDDGVGHGRVHRERGFERPAPVADPGDAARGAGRGHCGPGGGDARHPRERGHPGVADQDYATERRSGTFGDYGEFDLDLSFAPGDFSDDGACGCARAEKAVSVDLFDDRVHERTEVFGLRLSRKSGRLSVSSEDITAKIAEDDAEPALTLDANPVGIAEAGGAHRP